MKIKKVSGAGDREPLLPRFSQLFQEKKNRPQKGLSFGELLKRLLSKKD